MGAKFPITKAIRAALLVSLSIFPVALGDANDTIRIKPAHEHESYTDLITLQDGAQIKGATRWIDKERGLYTPRNSPGAQVEVTLHQDDRNRYEVITMPITFLSKVVMESGNEWGGQHATVHLTDGRIVAGAIRGTFWIGIILDGGPRRTTTNIKVANAIEIDFKHRNESEWLTITEATIQTSSSQTFRLEALRFQLLPTPPIVVGLDSRDVTTVGLDLKAERDTTGESNIRIRNITSIEFISREDDDTGLNIRVLHSDGRVFEGWVNRQLCINGVYLSGPLKSPPDPILKDSADHRSSIETNIHFRFPRKIGRYVDRIDRITHDTRLFRCRFADPSRDREFEIHIVADDAAHALRVAGTRYPNLGLAHDPVEVEKDESSRQDP